MRWRRTCAAVETDRRPERLDQLRHKLDEVGLEGLIVTHLPNVRYLLGFSGTAGALLVTQSETVFLTDFRYREQAEAEVGAVARVEIVPRDTWGRLIELVTEQSALSVVGFEAHALSAKQAQTLVSNGRLAFKGVADVVESLRESKDAGELEALRAAAVLACAALEATLPLVRVGMRELDVAALLEAELRTRGSEWHPFQTIVATGPRTALPHARTTSRRIQAGDWLLLDFGAQIGGYCADITRTYVVGRKPDDRQVTVHGLVQAAHERVRKHLHAGLTGEQADALARSVFEARGFADAFGHSLGHGLGLEVHEGPSLSRANRRPLPAGCVVTIEPGLYFPGWGGVRLEDDATLTDTGVELLSDGDISLREIG